MDTFVLFLILCVIAIISKIKSNNNTYSGNLFPDENFIQADNIDSAKCPQCNKVATTHDEVVKDFGLRRYAGITDAQSWCRQCRRDKDESEDKSDNPKLDLFSN